MKFLDTNALFWELPKEKFYISSVTLEELENIKTSFNKGEDIKYQARKILRLLDKKEVEYEIIQFKERMLKPIIKADFSITNDTKIIATALSLGDKQLEFVTNDLACKTIASTFFKNVSSNLEDKTEEYLGYKEVILSDDEMCDFYSDLSKNQFGLLVNEYLLIKNIQGEEIDVYCWNGSTHRQLNAYGFFSDYFGELKPYKKDIYQRMAFDSLANNQLTVLRGPAGTGKSILGLGYLFSLLDSGKIEKIVIFCNTVATKGAAKLGFYPGDKNSKLLDSQIGNLLASKLGDMMLVERLVEEEKIVLMPLSDIRGYDTGGMNCGIYADEIQNTTVEMMKLLLQRIGEDSVAVLCGDDKAQVDLADYEGVNNGLKRMCEVYKGEPYFGEVTLQNCYRSRIAKKALEM